MKVFDFLKPVRLIVLSALIFCCSLAAYAQGDAKLLTGRVTDTQGQPLIGASVLIKGDINRGTYAGADGTFSLDVKPGERSWYFRTSGTKSKKSLTRDKPRST